MALVGAIENVGSRIFAELTGRGHAVTAIARKIDGIEAVPGVTVVRGDANDEAGLAELLGGGHDAVGSAVMFIASDATKLIGAMCASGVWRYLVVGGADSLEVAPGVKIVDTPDFPAAYKGEATAGSVFLDVRRNVDDLDWTFLSPSALFFPGGRTGTFRLGTDRLLVNDQGSISFEDYAIALVDELETPAHVRQRFTIGY